MSNRILVPLDGSETAEAVLPHLRRFLSRHSAELVLLQVVPGFAPDFHFAVPGQHEEVSAYLRKRTFEFINEGIQARGIVQQGHAATRILEAAKSEGASMIAIATHGRTGLPRFVMGSVAEKILRASGVPVLLVRSFPDPTLSRGRLEARPFHRILVPVDGSPAVAPAIDLVLGFAKPLDANVTLLQVEEPDPQAPHWPSPGSPIQEAQRRLTEACIPNVLEVAQGDPASEILRKSEDGWTDLVVMSSHGRSGPSRWVFGSVTEKVLRAARVPLLVTRRESGTAQDSPQAREMSTPLPPA